jgi:hypothetical protein
MPEPHRRRGVTGAAAASPRPRRLRSWRTLVPAAIGVTALALAAGAAAAVGDGDTLVFDASRVVDGPGGYEFALANSASQSAVSVYSSEQGAQGPRLAIRTVHSGPAPSGGDTLCGASWQSESSGESYQEALARLDGYYGGLESVRVFYTGLPANWPGKLDADGRPMVVSFKADPADVAAGRHDARLSRWFEEAPRDQDIYWSFFHEPENNIEAGEYTADEYRRAWRHLSDLASEVDNPRLYATLILMGWSVNPQSGRDWTDYYPGREYLDVIAWDLYNPGWQNNVYRPVEDIFRDVIRTSGEIGLPWGIAETGSGLIEGDAGEGRARWVRDLAAHLSAEGALFVQYFDIDWTEEGAADYRLRDAPGKSAWRDFCDS